MHTSTRIGCTMYMLYIVVYNVHVVYCGVPEYTSYRVYNVHVVYCGVPEYTSYRV